MLECPVCRDFLQPPLKQCCNGHVVCFSCWPRLSLCPACRAPFIPTASLVLDGVLRVLRFPCPHREHGCTLYLKMDDRAQHDVVSIDTQPSYLTSKPTGMIQATSPRGMPEIVIGPLPLPLHGLRGLWTTPVVRYGPYHVLNAITLA